jgi:hypothetical protein
MKNLKVAGHLVSCGFVSSFRSNERSQQDDGVNNSGSELKPGLKAQFSAECRPPVPARKATFARSGSYDSGWVQFQ